jgi:uncharacterized protein (DUF488 family)
LDSGAIRVNAHLIELPVYTIGYGSRTMDRFLTVLRENEIGCLVDVRSSPYSRFRPEYSRESLDASLKEAGVRYVFLGEQLGGRPDAPECYVDGKVEYERVSAREPYKRGIERVVRAREQGMRVALMCSEGKPEECHRSKLIGATLVEQGIPVVHIDEEDTPQTQDAVIGRLTGHQLGLFGEPTFTSRKRYEPNP